MEEIVKEYLTTWYKACHPKDSNHALFSGFGLHTGALTFMICKQPNQHEKDILREYGKYVSNAFEESICKGSGSAFQKLPSKFGNAYRRAFVRKELNQKTILDDYLLDWLYATAYEPDWYSKLYGLCSNVCSWVNLLKVPKSEGNECIKLVKGMLCNETDVPFNKDVYSYEVERDKGTNIARRTWVCNQLGIPVDWEASYQ